MSRESNVFFDLDGTLTDPRVGIVRSVQHAFRCLGRAAPREEDLLTWIGPPLIDSFREHVGAELADAAVAHYRERFGTLGLYENVLYPDVPSTLKNLINKGFLLFIVTSKPTAYAEPIARHFALAEFFTGIYGSELDGRLANKADLIAHVLKQELIDHKSVVMIGDRRHDIDGARANSVRSIGALWGFGSRAELAGADATCARFGDIPDRLG